MARFRIKGELTCQTCREHEAGYVALLNGEAWVVCIRCKEQSVRVKSAVRHTYLGAVEVDVA